MTHWVRFEQGAQAKFGTFDAAAGLLQPHDGTMFDQPTPVGSPVSLDDVRLLPPVEPGKFIGLWNNFHEMAVKQGNAIPAFPLFFLKATSSLIGSGTTIRRPSQLSGRMIYEGELGIVIGQRCHGVDEVEAERNIFGYTCINDVTALDPLTADPAFPQWARAKSSDTFGPCGPAIATGLDWRDLRIRTVLNGRERQNYPASDMILPPPRIISLLSQEMTLEPGDLIACGTSLGALPIKGGNVVEIVIDGIGTLRNEVVE